MEKWTLVLLLAATYNLGQNPVETDVWATKTIKLDGNGPNWFDFLSQKMADKTAFLNPIFDQKTAPAEHVETSQMTEVSLPPKVLLGL